MPQYDLLLQNGHVIDPKNNIDQVNDVAIANGRIACVAAGILAAEAEKVVDVEGLYVTPGLAYFQHQLKSYSSLSVFGSISPLYLRFGQLVWR